MSSETSSSHPASPEHKDDDSSSDSSDTGADSTISTASKGTTGTEPDGDATGEKPTETESKEPPTTEVQSPKPDVKDGSEATTPKAPDDAKSNANESAVTVGDSKETTAKPELKTESTPPKDDSKATDAAASEKDATFSAPFEFATHAASEPARPSSTETIAGETASPSSVVSTADDRSADSARPTATEPSSLASSFFLAFQDWRAERQNKALSELSLAKETCESELNEAWKAVESLQNSSDPWTPETRDTMSRYRAEIWPRLGRCRKLTKKMEKQLRRMRKKQSLPDGFSHNYSETGVINLARKQIVSCGRETLGLMTDHHLNDTERDQVEYLKKSGAELSQLIQTLTATRAEQWGKDCERSYQAKKTQQGG